MNDLNGIGKILIIAGIVLIVVGLLVVFANKIPFLGKVPGDFSWKGKNWFVYFPLGTSILISILLSLIMYFIRKFNH